MRCRKRNEDRRNIEWLKIKTAWASSSTICRLGLVPIEKYIPNVTGLDVDVDGNKVSINWNTSNIYFTEIQIKSNDGAWATLPIKQAGIGHA